MKSTARATAAAAVVASALVSTPFAASDDTPIPRPTSRYCFGIANNMDIPGNDFRSQQTSSSDECLNLCKFDYSCEAWTWSNNGGRCWLKGGHGSATFYGGAVSGVKVDCYQQRNAMYLVVDNCDAAGNDDRSYAARTYEKCWESGAAAFTWSDWNGGTCWLKWGASQCQYAPNKFTGVLVW